MNGLSKFLVDNILEESTGQVTALYGGGFKPPTKGHLEVVLKGLQQTPEVNKLKILVGQKERNGFTQDQSVKIWNLYNNIDLIPIDIEVIPVNSPFNYYKEYLREHPEDKTYVFMGSRDGDKDDQFDVKQRSEFIKKYSDNVIPLEISTTGGVSGTEARKLFKTDIGSFRNMFPENLTDNDFKRILNILGKKDNLEVSPSPTMENIKIIKTITPPKVDIMEKNSDPFGLNQIVKEIMEDEFDYQPHIDSLTTYLKEKGENIEPLPKIIFIKDDDKNAKGILGKTAYYDPNQQEIILYTYLRHPKDVLRSLAHEFIHHKQNLEGRLGDITTDNTKEDDNLKKIEKEAYTDGNLNFREWTQTLNESLHHIFTKKKIILNERRWTRSDSKVSEQEQTKYWALYSHLFDYLKKGNVDIEDMENQIKSGTKSQKSKQETLNALYYFWKLIEDSEFDTEFGLHKER